MRRRGPAKQPLSIGQQIVRLQQEIEALKSPVAIKNREQKVEALREQFRSLTTTGMLGEVSVVQGRCLDPLARSARLFDTTARRHLDEIVKPLIRWMESERIAKRDSAGAAS